MIKVGITGQSGFVGTHLYNTLGLYPGEFERVPFEDDYFVDVERLKTFVKSCDVIVHLAAVNRHTDAHVLYETNMRLVKQLIEAMETTNSRPYVLFSSRIMSMVVVRVMVVNCWKNGLCVMGHLLQEW